MVFEVFARKNRGEALRHIGNLNAPDEALARVYAFQTYDEDRWFDMWITPRAGMIEVFNREPLDTAEWWQDLPTPAVGA
jgi:1,2-phenylacetyl-CoA epoxidase PaaB subunit